MKFRYFIINKPFGILSQFTPEGKREGLGSIYEFPKDIYPVGRLDADSEGLLILTNDPTLNKRLLDPKNGHHRTYLIQVEGISDQNTCKNLMEGVHIRIKGKDYLAKAIYADNIQNIDIQERIPPIRFRKAVPTSWIRLILGEGKNRQVRKMTAAVNYPTLRLLRTAIGDLTIDHLEKKTVIEIEDNLLKSLIFNK